MAAQKQKNSSRKMRNTHTQAMKNNKKTQ